MKTINSYVKYVRYYIIRQKLLHYQARAVYYVIIQTLHSQAASLLRYQATNLLHYQAVITLTGDYYIIGCNTRQFLLQTVLHSHLHSQFLHTPRQLS